MKHSIFMLGHRKDDEAAVSELVGRPAARFFTLAHRIMWGVSQPDLVRIDVEAARAAVVKDPGAVRQLTFSTPSLAGQRTPRLGRCGARACGVPRQGTPTRMALSDRSRVGRRGSRARIGGSYSRPSLADTGMVPDTRHTASEQRRWNACAHRFRRPGVSECGRPLPMRSPHRSTPLARSGG